MSWISYGTPIHKCELPELTHNENPGAVWECDECTAHWMVKVDPITHMRRWMDLDPNKHD